MFKPSSAFNRTARVLLPAASIALAQGALAQGFTSQNFIKGGEETLTLNLGAILNQYNTKLQLNGQVQGTDLKLEDEGLPKTTSSFEAAATWRFFSRNRIDLLYFESNRSGSRTLDRTIEIGNQSYPVGFNLDTSLKNQFLIGDYRFSFLKNDTFEVAGLLGIYGAQVKFNASATGIVSGASASISTTASTTLPLPLIGVTLDWYITPRWKIGGNLSGLSAHISNVSGSILVAAVSTDFMLVRNFGLGLTYMYTDLNVDVTKNNFNGNFNWKTNSLLGYAEFKF